MQAYSGKVSNGWGAEAAWRSAAVLALALALVACGGGGGGSSGSGAGTGTGSPPPPPPPPPPSGRASLVVQVVDAFGIPVPSATVSHYLGSDTVSSQTDSEGAVALDVPAGTGRVVATSIFGRQEVPVDLARDERAELRLALVPQPNDAFAVLRAEVVPGSVAADGRSAELRIALAGGGQIYPWSFERDPCVARAGAELAALGPACLDAGDGTDLGWAPVGEFEVGGVTTGSAVVAGPVLVLLDRSQRAGEIDGREEHLFAAKALVASLLENRPVAVGAFAGDGGLSGTASLLPEMPVTFYPVENPGWITDRVAAFEALESLRGRMGGSSALAAAIQSGTDFLLARTDPAERPALVVLTAGAAEGCSYDSSPGPDAASQCLAIRAAAQRARQAGIALWLVGPGDSWYPSSTTYASPGSLISVAREAPEGWAAATLAGSVYAAIDLVRRVLSGAPVFREVRFRISFDAQGALAVGAEVRGELFIWDQGFGAWNQRLPFRAKVPAPAG